MPLLLRKRIQTAVDLLLHSKGVRKFIKLFSVDVLARVSNFLLLPVYLRLMTQAEFGIYGYLFTAIGLFASLLNLGLYVSQTKLWFTPEVNRGSLLFTINVLTWGVTAFVLLVLGITNLDSWLLNLLFKQTVQLESYRGVLYMGVCASLMTIFFQNHLTNTEQTSVLQRYNFVKVIGIHIISLTALLNWRSNASGVRLYAQYSAEIAVNLLFLHTYIKYFNFIFDKKLIFKILKLGIPVLGAAFAGLFYNFMDRFLLEKYTSLNELGTYNLGMTLASVVLLILMSFHTLYMPQFMKISHREELISVSKRVLRRISLVLITVGIVIWLGTVFALWIEIIQAKYFSVVYFLPILLLSYWFQSINIMLVLFYVKFNDTRYALLTSLILASISTTLNFTLIPTFESLGAAIAGALSHGFCVLVNLFFIKRLILKNNQSEIL